MLLNPPEFLIHLFYLSPPLPPSSSLHQDLDWTGPMITSKFRGCGWGVTQDYVATCTLKKFNPVHTPPQLPPITSGKEWVLSNLGLGLGLGFPLFVLNFTYRALGCLNACFLLRWQLDCCWATQDLCELIFSDVGWELQVIAQFQEAFEYIIRLLV